EGQTGVRRRCFATSAAGVRHPLKRTRSCFIALVKGDDFHPVRALAGRVASDRLQRAGLNVDRVRRDSVRLLAGHDNESAGRVDIETAGLLLRRRASEIGGLSTRGIDAEGGERARRALRSVEKAAV